MCPPRNFRIGLETPRFHLRPLVAEDVDWLTAMHMDADVNRFLWDRAETYQKAKRTAEVMIELDQYRHHFGQWAILEKESGFAHGWTELGKLRPWSGPSDEIAVSYVLRRDSWGCGIATEATGRLLQYAFEVHRLERVMAVIRLENKASRRVLEKLGLRAITTCDLESGDRLEYFTIEAPTH